MAHVNMQKTTDDAAELWIYGDIGSGMWGDGVSAKQVADALQSVGPVKHISLRMNSSGGDVFEGVAIYNQLKRNKATVSVDIDGSALSIASIIAMAADPGQLRMADNAMMMIHDPWTITIGDSSDHRKSAELLDNIKGQLVNTYVARTGADAADVERMMAEETWMDAKTAESLGFIDERVGELAVAAHVNERLCRNMPEYLKHWQELSAKALKQRSAELLIALDKISAKCV